MLIGDLNNQLDIHSCPLKESDTIFLGIDSGQSNIKVTAFDNQGNEIISANEAVNILTPCTGFYEVDLQELWMKTRKLLRKITGKINPKFIKCIGLSGHAGGLYALDRDLKPLKFGILPTDQRANIILERLKQIGICKELFEKTGMPLMPGFAIFILKWLKEFKREVYERLSYVFARKDFIRYKLTGDISTEISDACFGFLNVYTQNYDEDIFELVGIRDAFHLLPELRDTSYEIAGYVTKEAAEETGLREGTPVIVGAHDACCNLIGSGAIRGDAMCSAGGTWSINLLVIDRPFLNPMWSCESFVRKKTWMLEQYSPTAAISLNWFIENFFREEKQKAQIERKNVYELIDEEIANINAKLLFLPFLLGLPPGYPYQSNASAAFLGIRFEDQKLTFLRALYEGIAFIKAVHLEQYEKYFKIKEIRFTGGMAKSRVFPQLLADVTGKKVIIVDKEETGCFGAAFLAAMGIKEVKDLEEVFKYLRTKKTYFPKKSYARKYALFKTCCQRLSEIWNEFEKLRFQEDDEDLVK